MEGVEGIETALEVSLVSNKGFWPSWSGSERRLEVDKKTLAEPDMASRYVASGQGVTYSGC
ncbi:hypothetical protein [Acidithiobacillus ferrivorans]|uniref:hypothetical protein n=1 Tax=Acidithiobacillus ferrivorans TaxID=160808 RepID=UPI001177F2FE|nr:hypothetical protein [Acidithiobacillus ferrivorans]